MSNSDVTIIIPSAAAELFLQEIPLRYCTAGAGVLLELLELLELPSNSHVTPHQSNSPQNLVLKNQVTGQPARTLPAHNHSPACPFFNL